ncbi:MAG: hypothetical protein Q8L14_20170 [Myxococcales bacterium]|nr:hypothetical protein [Myxococcales bacterium]
MLRTSAVLFAGFFVACGGPLSVVDDGSTDDVEAQTDAELTKLVRAEGGGLTVTFKPVLVSRIENNEKKWIMQGTASRDLSEAFSFVPDDAFGEARLTGARTFEVALTDGHELNSILSGLKLLVKLTPQGSTRSITAGVDLQPRFMSIKGSTRIIVVPEVNPVYARGGLTYRGRARAASGMLTSVTTPDAATINVALRTAGLGEYDVDFTYDNLALALDVPGPTAVAVQFNGASTTGQARTKFSVLGVTVKALALTTDDPYDVWPSARCSTAVRTCLNATPVGATDFGDCGSYREVNACGLPNQIPALFPSPDDLTPLNQALAALQTPAGKSVTFSVYGLHSTRNVTPELAARAWLDQTSTTATIGAALTPGKVNTLLDGWSARTMVPAAQRAMFQNTFRAVRLDGAGETHVVLFFSSAARMVVFTLR